MPKTIDLSDFLPKGSLDEFLPPPSTPPPSEVLSPPEALILFWQHHHCSCGRTYECPEHGALLRHTLSRRHGFGLRPIGVVYIPLVPGTDVSSLPQEIRTKESNIVACPACLGSRPSLDLFPDLPTNFVVSSSGAAGSPHAMAFREAHKCTNPSTHHQTELDMKRRNYDIEDTLTFRTTHLDLQSSIANQVLCDPEKQIEEWK